MLKKPLFQCEIKTPYSQFHEHIFRSSRMQMFFKTGVLKRFANFTGKHCVGVSSYKKRLQHTQVFSCEVGKFLTIPFLTEHLR